MSETPGTENSIPDRMRELEIENARLRDELARAEARFQQEHKMLIAHIVADLPQTDEEMTRYLANSVPFEDVIRDLEAEFGPFPTGERM